MVKLLRSRKRKSSKDSRGSKKASNKNTKVTNQKRQISFLYYRRLIKTFLILGLLLLLGSGLALWRQSLNNPDNVFWGAIENNLRSTGATRNIKQKNGIVTTDQYIQFVTGVPHLAQGVTEIKQDSRPPINIVTETIGTPYKDFVRYTKAETGQKNAKGGVEDFSSILNIWGVSGTEPGSDQTGGQFYADSILNIIPSANLTYQQRKEVMATLRNAYTFTNNEVLKDSEDSRPVYQYTVTVNFENYIKGLKQVAQYVGLSQLDSVDPSAFASRPPAVIQLKVDVWSRTVSSVLLGDEGGRTEEFVSRGITNPKIEVPVSNLVPLSELQDRINIIDQEK